jgi:alkanesulfonate monooxygenase SsuD/methylene tetrahydromethanopterin reductase-like flavin-dependent oxidoreductase (luciferase family)
MNVPGYIDEKTRAKLLRGRALGRPIGTPIDHLIYAPVEELVEGGYFFAGNPDSVFEQIKRFYGRVGGFGNLMMMVQTGTMGYDLVEGSLRRFAEQVLPRVREEVYGREIEPDLAAAS